MEHGRSIRDAPCADGSCRAVAAAAKPDNAHRSPLTAIRVDPST
jgi:hypothetical protein